MPAVIPAILSGGASLLGNKRVQNIATGGLSGALHGGGPESILSGGVMGQGGPRWQNQPSPENTPFRWANQQPQGGFGGMGVAVAPMAGMLAQHFAQQGQQKQPQAQAQPMQQQPQQAPQPAAQPKMGYEEWKAKGRPNVPHEG